MSLRSTTGRRHVLHVALLSALAGVLPSGHAADVFAQVATSGPDTSAVVADPADVESVARAAQAQFEQRRIRLLPLTIEPFGGSCDEVVGRLCTTYGEGEWYPTPEDPEIGALRNELIQRLDSLQSAAPSSAWILGQRVWYRAESGDDHAALAVARACARADPAWCSALEGFALHRLGRYEAAEVAFDHALSGLDPETASAWRRPERAVDGDLRDRLEARDGDPEGLAALLDRMWQLADPLWMVPGNDRLTEHYARWTATRMRDRARNPFRLSWGSDLDELTVRHGWEVGWERRPSRDFGTLDHVVGHKHPEGRDYMPPGAVLDDPATASEEDLRADRRRPKSLYAPAYAPVLLPMDGQLALFPHGRTTVIAASAFLPQDTTLHATHDHPVPWSLPGDQAGRPDRIGVYAYSLDNGRVTGVERVDRDDGALMLEVPTGAYVISVESWSPERRRAGRYRAGRPRRPAPEDIATLSDVLFVEAMDPEPATLEAAVQRALPRAEVHPAQPFGIVWEVAGLGFQAESLQFELSVEREDRNVLARIGDFLGLSSPPRPLGLAWEEPGPEEPSTLLRYVTLDLPELEEGRYEIRLVLRTAGRADAVVTRPFRVVPVR